MIVHALVTDAAAGVAAAQGGATVVQVRIKDAGTAARVRLGRALRHQLGSQVSVMIVMNDDIDAALECGADGVHLGQADQGVARALSAGLTLGRSAASVVEARAAEREGAAYVGAGPVWPTPTKDDGSPAFGLVGLREICAAVALPVVAIGGVNSANAGECIRAGAAGVAVVRAAAEIALVRRAVDAMVAMGNR